MGPSMKPFIMRIQNTIYTIILPIDESGKMEVPGAGVSIL